MHIIDHKLQYKAIITDAFEFTHYVPQCQYDPLSIVKSSNIILHNHYHMPNRYCAFQSNYIFFASALDADYSNYSNQPNQENWKLINSNGSQPNVTLDKSKSNSTIYIWTCNILSNWNESAVRKPSHQEGTKNAKQNLKTKREKAHFNFQYCICSLYGFQQQ